MPNLHTTKTVKLRKLAEKAKVPGWDILERKPLIAALKALEPKKKQKDKKVKKTKSEKVESKVESDSEPPSGEEEDKIVTPGVEEVRFRVGSKAAKMKARLAKQPKVTILIPLEPGEPRGATMSVIINDYRLNIRKGMYVEVPRQVATIIKDSQKQTILAAEHDRLLDGKADKGKKKALDL